MGRKRVNTPKKPQERVSVTLHFIRGVPEDDAFIEALEKIDKGDRSYKIKKVVMGKLPEIATLQPQYAASLEDVTSRLLWLQEALYVLPQTFEEMLSKVSLRAVGPMHPPATPLTNNTASQEDLDRRKNRMKKNEWT